MNWLTKNAKVIIQKIKLQLKNLNWKKIIPWLFLISLVILIVIFRKILSSLDWDNWPVYLTAIGSILIAILAFVQELLKNWWNKPTLVFLYEDKNPFRRENIAILETSLIGVFERFMVKNIGRGPAINCRSQILEIRQNNERFGDYDGFPLHWASRPDFNERLNIGRGEREFLDIAVAVNSNSNLYLVSYHTTPIGIPNLLPFGNYEFRVIFSGDNFRPYLLLFEINRPNTNNSKDLFVRLSKVSQL